MSELKKEDFLTWRKLLEFCKTVPEEHLDNVVRLQECDKDVWVKEALFREPIYYNKHEEDDVLDAEEFKSQVNKGWIENTEDYVYSDTKPPFLYSN